MNEDLPHSSPQHHVCRTVRRPPSVSRTASEGSSSSSPQGSRPDSSHCGARHRDRLPCRTHGPSCHILPTPMTHKAPCPPETAGATGKHEASPRGDTFEGPKPETTDGWGRVNRHGKPVTTSDRDFFITSGPLLHRVDRWLHHARFPSSRRYTS